jgi:CHAT domain-containing protein/tetratricopeptide (TPR) repeat protein
MNDLEEAFENLQMAVDAAATQPTERAMFLNNLGNRLSSRYKRSGNLEDLKSAIAKSRAAITSHEPDRFRRAMYLNSFGNRLAKRYDELGDLGDILQACDTSSQAVQLLPLDHPSRAMYLNNLGSHFLRKYKTTLDSGDLNLALEKIQEAVRTTPAGHPNQALYLNNLGNGFFSKSRQTCDMDDLHEALANLRKAVDATPANHINYVIHTYNFAECALHMYNRTGDVECVKQALFDSKNPAVFLRKDHRCSGNYPEKIGEMFAIMSQRTGDVNCTEIALAKLKEAAAIFQDPRDQARCSDQVGRVHHQEFKRTNDPGTLDQAILETQNAVNLMPQNHPDRSTYLVDLADCFRTRFVQLGDLKDLEHALALAKEVADDDLGSNSSKSACLYILETMLSQKFERTGDIEYLQQALDIGEKLVDDVPRNDPVRAGFLNSLAVDLSRRFERTGDMTNLDQAIARLQEAIEITPEGSKGREILLASFGTRLFRRYERQRDPKDIEQAIFNLEEAMSLVSQEDPEKPMYLINLANMLVNIYERNNQRNDLERSLVLLQEALEKIHPDHPFRLVALYSLGDRFIRRYSQTANEGDLANALSNLQEAVSHTPRDHPNLAAFLNTLGSTLLAKSRRGDAPDSEQEAMLRFIDGVDCSSSPPLIRIVCARQAVAGLSRQRRWKEASDLAQTALDLLPALCSRFLARDDQQHALIQTANFASEACSLSLRLGSAEQALERLEFGRGLMLRYIMDSRNDLSALAKTQPELARRYLHLRMRVFRSETIQDYSLTPRTSQEEKHKAQRLLEDCENEIRRVSGFEYFLLPTPADEIRKHVDGGSIVYVNITDIGADAIIITKADIRALHLPGMLSVNPGYLGKALELHRNAEQRKSTRDAESDIQARNNVHFLSWLWSSCVRPILEEVAKYSPPDERHGLSRIWWIGTGAATSLPFHATGNFHPESSASFESCLCQSMSSYALSISSLAQARADALEWTRQASKGTSVTVVTMPTTPGQSDLHGVELEYKKSTEAIEQTGIVARLNRPTASQVLEEMSHTDMIHFACHGTSDQSNPLDSHLLLQKHEKSGIAVDKLTVSNILDAKKIRTTWLAYLSACSTAEVKAASLRDESIHLTSAFHIAGFTHVIGSLWSADDVVSAEIARLFYTNLQRYKMDTNAVDIVARALHSAIQIVSKQHRGRPEVWAPFIHLGP